MAFVGGLNVGDEYLGLLPSMSPRRDTHLEIRGPGEFLGARQSGAALLRFADAIGDEDLVVAASPEVPLLIAYGTPGAAVDRHRETYLLGLLGAGLAIMSAMIFAIMLSGGFGS